LRIPPPFHRLTCYALARIHHVYATFYVLLPSFARQKDCTTLRTPRFARSLRALPHTTATLCTLRISLHSSATCRARSLPRCVSPHPHAYHTTTFDLPGHAVYAVYVDCTPVDVLPLSALPARHRCSFAGPVCLPTCLATLPDGLPYTG